MRIGIVGPGAMGCLLAGEIALTGNEVILLDIIPERVEIINHRGLIIEGIQGTFQVKVPATLNPVDLLPTELILVCVKAYDTRIVAKVLHDIGSDAYVLTLQNGVGNVETLGEYHPKEKIIGGITSHGATDLGSGLVSHAGQGDTIIGYVFSRGDGDPSQDPQLNQVKSLLTEAGFVTQLVSKVENLIWSKR